jgi:hypothetical protein
MSASARSEQAAFPPPPIRWSDPCAARNRDGSLCERTIERVEVVPILHMSAGELAKVLRLSVRPRHTYLSCVLYRPGSAPEPDRSEERVVVRDETHSLVLTGTQEQLDRWWEQIAHFDAHPKRNPWSLDRVPRTR